MVVFSRVLSIFILVVVGFAARKSKILDGPMVKGLAGLILNVAIPFTIIASFDRSIPSSAMPDLLRMALWAVAIHAFGILFSWVLYRKTSVAERKVLTYITVFSNCGFMGFPVTESVFGKIGVMYASIFVIIFQIFIWTYGIYLFSGRSGKDQLMRAIINPGNISVVIGLTLWLLPFSLPDALTTAISNLSNLTTPLSMIVVGATLAEVPIKGILKGGALWFGTAIRLIAMPLAVFGIMSLFGFRDLPAKVAAFLTSMPAAAQTVIFAERYQADVPLASRVVFLTTVLSAITIPIFALFLV